MLDMQEVTSSNLVSPTIFYNVLLINLLASYASRIVQEMTSCLSNYA